MPTEVEDSDDNGFVTAREDGEVADDLDSFGGLGIAGSDGVPAIVDWLKVKGGVVVNFSVDVLVEEKGDAETGVADADWLNGKRGVETSLAVPGATAVEATMDAVVDG